MVVLLVVFGALPASGATIVGDAAGGAVLVHAYDLNGGFDDTLGGPALVPGGGTIGPTGYSFGPQQGLTLSGALPDAEDYSLELVFNWASLPAQSWYKIVDYHDRTSDNGLYTYQDSLQFWPEPEGPAGVFRENVDAHVVLTRDGASGTVIGYVDGTQQVVFTDDGGIAVSPSNALRFFIDDFEVPDEAGAGFADLICIYDGALTASEVGRLVTNPCSSLGRDVDIDIKPGSTPNSINPRSRGKIPVAMLSGPGFDAPSEIDRASLSFGATGDEESLAFCSRGGEDVNGDGLLDLVCHFGTRKAGFSPGDTEGILRGRLNDGTSIEGKDSVRLLAVQTPRVR